MTNFRNELPENNQSVRQALYDGELFLLPSQEVTRELVAAVWKEVERELGQDGPVREAQFRLTDDEFFGRIGQLRKRFYTSPVFHEWAVQVISQFGFAADENAFDPIRLRVISHLGHNNPAAQPMYYGHLDTWYSNPQAMVTWWIPLHDVVPDETFEFYPEDFSHRVHNDSEVFDFDAWVVDGQKRRIGWQDKATGRMSRYPQLLEDPQGRRIPVASNVGDVLMFSGQHLHQTRPNVTGKTRFSLDFRTVHLEDHARQIEPRNVDNRSTGCSLRQFVHPKT